MKLKIWKDLTEMQSWTIRNINEFYLGTINYNYSGRSIMKRNKFRKIGTVNTCYGYEMGWGNSLDQRSLFQAVAAR